MTREEAKREMLFAKRNVVADSWIDKAYDMAIQALSEPERKKGKWIKMSDSDGDYYCCNNCGEELQRYITEVPTWDRPYPSKYSIDRTDWCPSCGAKMEGVEE